MSKNTTNWMKAIFFVSILFAANLAFATDTVSITELNTSATDAKSVINFIAKWGGMAVVIVVGTMLAFGKFKGEMATVLASLAIGVGVIAAAYGTYQSRISEGVDFTSIHHVQTQTNHINTIPSSALILKGIK
jgi:hypothetical protein